MLKSLHKQFMRDTRYFVHSKTYGAQQNAIQRPEVYAHVEAPEEIPPRTQSDREAVPSMTDLEPADTQQRTSQR